MRCFKRHKARPITAPRRPGGAVPWMRLNREVKLNHGNWMNRGETKNQRCTHTHTKDSPEAHLRPLWLFHRIPSRVCSLGPQGPSHTEDGTHRLHLEDRSGHGGDLSNSRIHQNFTAGYPWWWLFNRLSLTLCDPMACSMPGSPVLHHPLEFAHWVGDAIQPSHPLRPPSPLAFNLSQHQGLFQRKNSVSGKPWGVPGDGPRP